MPTGKLPASGAKLWESIYDKELKGECNGDEKCAAKRAWGAVRQAGWKKDAEGNWHKKADLREFSLAITKASFDPTTQERRWRGQASDIFSDSYGDNMTPELFDDFKQRIQAKEPPPEDFRSEFWAGGMPYLSISHYPDLDGEAVPGSIIELMIDGSYLKAKGKVAETPLGEAVWKALKDDLEKKRSDPVRISIAFLDWSHKHKGSGFVFERADINDFCPECLRELVEGEYNGREFLKGQLIHLALTRVPVNQRTLMEVDRSMTTRKEDAESIIGELAEDLDEKAKLIGKSEALVIKSDDDDAEAEEEPTTEEPEVEPVVEEAKTKKDEEKPEEDDMEDEEEEKGKKKPPFKKKSAVVDLAPVLQSIEELKALLVPVVPQPHILDAAILNLKANFDAVRSGEGTTDEKLKALQPTFASLGEEIKAKMKEGITPEQAEEDRLVKVLSQVIKPIEERLGKLETAKPTGVPVQRSFQNQPNFNPPISPAPIEFGAPVKIEDFAKRSVGSP